MVTASIVTYKTGIEELQRCLDSLSSPLLVKIYIIDNSNEKYIADYCANREKVVYMGGKNIGYGAGHNKALRQVLDNNESKYHLVLNSDVYFQPDAIDKIAAYMDENEDIAQVQPNIVYPDGEMQYTCRLLPNPIILIFRRFLPKFLFEKMNYNYLLKFNDHTKPMNIPYHQGSFMFFRTECFKTVGLFDERFFMYPEDIDITRRMHRNFRTMFWPEVTIVHNHRATSYKNKKILFIHITNMIKYFNKWGWIFDTERKEWNARILRDYHQS